MIVYKCPLCKRVSDEFEKEMVMVVCKSCMVKMEVDEE